MFFIFILNIERAGIWKRAYLLTSKGRVKPVGRCDSEANLGSVLRSNLQMLKALQKKES